MDYFKDKKVLVTGGCGFIGSHIVERLVALQASVVVLDNLSSGKLENIASVKDKVIFLKEDYSDESVLAKALKGIDLICHQAALRSVPKSVTRPKEYHQTNVSGTLNLFLQAKEYGIKRIVCASSSSVYGDRTDFPEKEADLPRPISPYAATKLIIEHYAHVFNYLYGTEIINLRYFNVFGPKQSLDDEYAVVVPKFVVSLLNNQSPPIFGDGQQSRDFTYVENVVEANVKALSAQNPKTAVFNVASGSPQTVNDLFALIKNVTKAKVEATYKPPRLGDVLKTHADISRIQAELGFRPKIDFAQGIKLTVDWFKLKNQK